MKKKIYRTPSIRIVELRGEGLLAASYPSLEPGEGSGPGVGDAKRQTRIIIDDEEEDEWEDY